MKIPALLFAVLLTAGCDMEKVTSVSSEPATPASSEPAPRSAATPTPKPKQGDWMYKDYKNPLDQKKKK